MKKLSGADLLEALQWRNATKKFDNSKKIDTDTWNALEKALILTPSSYGIMPYKFIIVQSQTLKDELKAASYGQQQVSDCSHHVVFVAKEKMDLEHVKKYIDQIASVRGIKSEDLAGFETMMVKQLIDNMSAEQSLKWASNQAYIALGNFMTAAAVLGVDACPTGFRAADDKYAELKKVRFDAKDLIVHK